jgi:sugar lactone lactonase YvrE
VVTTFGPQNGVFAESLAVGPDGALYASVTTWARRGIGQVYRITPDGSQQPYGQPVALGGCGLLTGLAFDQFGRLYVAAPNYCGEPSVVYKVTSSALDPWVTLPAFTFPNGLAAHGGSLYITESWGGAIYRAPLAAASTQRTPWYEDPVLAAQPNLGANGITFLGDTLYVTVSDTGTIWRMPGGQAIPGPLTRFAQDPRLVTADGTTADGHGGLWVAVNGEPGHAGKLAGQAVIDVTANGTLGAAVTDATWMNYPTQPVVRRDSLYLENGAYDYGIASIVSMSLS